MMIDVQHGIHHVVMPAVPNTICGAGRLNRAYEHMFDAGECLKSPVLTGRRLAILLLLYAKGDARSFNTPIDGRTRITKMLFLLDNEYDVFRRAANLDFEPYAFGPYDPQIYDELAFLENMGWLRGHHNAPGAPTFSDLIGDGNSVAFLDAPELNEADLSFEYLMSGVSEGLPERYETTRYALSEAGMQLVHNSINGTRHDKTFPAIMKAVEEVKTRFNNMPLRDLLRYVYRKYPDSATDSTILEEMRLR